MSSTRKHPVLGTESEALIASPCLYRGFTFTETTGTDSVVVTLYDNDSAAEGDVLDSIPIGAGGGVAAFYDSGATDSGIIVENGIYVDITGGGEVVGHVRTN